MLIHQCFGIRGRNKIYCIFIIKKKKEMKRNLFTKTGVLSLVVGLLATTLFSSCLKDKSPGTIDFSDSPALVSFQYKGFSATPMLVKLFAQPNVKYNLELTLSVASVTQSTPVTVNVVPDP